MFAFLSRTKAVYRISLIAVIVFNSFASSAASAKRVFDDPAAPVDSTSDNLLTNLSLGESDFSVNEPVPVLAEQLAKQAQQTQDEKPMRFKAWAEPAAYTPGTPINLRWKVQNMKQADLDATAVVILGAGIN